MSSTDQSPTPVLMCGVMLGAVSPSGPSAAPAIRSSRFNPPAQSRGVWHSAQCVTARTR